jgi:hypothetical protein
MQVQLHPVFATLEFVAQCCLVDTSARHDAPVGEVVAQQPEAFVDVSAVGQALQKHPRQLGLRVVERGVHHAILTPKAIGGQSWADKHARPEPDL